MRACNRRTYWTIATPPRRSGPGGRTGRIVSTISLAPLDPWLAIRAACTRTADRRPAWHAEQILDRLVALRASVAVPSLTEHSPADLVVLGADPLTFPAEDLREIPVQQTLCAGKVTFEN